MVSTSDDGETVSSTALREAVTDSLVAEFSTVREGRPATVPVTPFYDRDRDLVVATASPAFAGKAERAAANPKVGMVLHGSDGLLHLTGTATVRDDDLEANAEQVERLIRDEPPSEKRAALLETTEFMRTRLGRLLLDWYALRILIEIDPVSVGAVPGQTTSGVSTWSDVNVSAWPAVNVGAAEAATYDRAVATVADADGWPRTWPLDRAAFADGRLRLSPPGEVEPADGQPACVLCHGFSRDLRDVTQRLVRGRVRERADGFVFDPASSFRLRNVTALDFVRFVADGKRRTRRFFRERGESYRVLPGLETLFR